MRYQPNHLESADLARKAWEWAMRIMDIPSVERPAEISNVGAFLDVRLRQLRPNRVRQAAPLVAYMMSPNDLEAIRLRATVLEGSYETDIAPPPKLARIQADWLLVSDLFHLQLDLDVGGHQKGRGGASIGKAAHLARASIRKRGASLSNAWRAWAEYKDVGHLVTAASIVTAQVREGLKAGAEGVIVPFGQVQPFQMTMLLPELVIGYGLWLQEYGLNHAAKGGKESLLDPDTLWRIPDTINIRPIEPPFRKIDKAGLAALNARRAGKRGKHGRA